MADRDGLSTDGSVHSSSTAHTHRPKLERMGRGVWDKSMNFTIPTNQGTHDHAKEKHGESSWRFKVVRFTHSTQVQIVLMGLLFLDVIILFLELLFLAQYPHCSIIERDAISCCPAASSEGEEEEHHSSHHFCETPLEAASSHEAGCDEHKWSNIHTTEMVLFGLTVAILSLFFVELNASMIALTPQVFFRQFFFLLDYVIITVSLAMELAFHFLDEFIFQSLVGILVVMRIWRFIRIGHGIVEITNELAHNQYEGLLAYTATLEDLLKERNVPLPLNKLRSGEDDDNLLHKIEHVRLEERKRKLGVKTQQHRDAL